jgi:lipopolysaccharide assembly protein B
MDLLRRWPLLEPEDRPAAERSACCKHLQQRPTCRPRALLALPRRPGPPKPGRPCASGGPQAARPLQRYRCAACGFEAQHYFWQCPGCLSWDSYPPQRIEEQ